MCGAMPTEILDADELREFGQAFGRLRRHGNLSVSGAARKLGVDRGTIERWESGLKQDDPPKRRGLALGLAEATNEDPADWFEQSYEPALSVRVAALEEMTRTLRSLALAEQEEAQDFREQLERGAAFAPPPEPSTEHPEDQKPAAENP